MAAGAVAVPAIGTLGSCSAGEHPPVGDAATSSAPSTDAGTRATDRALVVIELPGGNDGLSTLVPADDGRYHDARPTLALADEELVPFGSGLSLNGALGPLREGGLAALLGVGTRAPSLSHFDMLARWWRGSGSAGGRDDSGFLGRMSDRLGRPGEVTALSIGRLPTPAVATLRRTSVGLPDDQQIAASAPLRRALVAMGRDDPAGSSVLVADARAGLRQTLTIDTFLDDLVPASPGYPSLDGAADAFTARMVLASRVLRSDLGVRVIHVAGADGAVFDTHDDHRSGHARAWAAIVPGLTAFRRDLERSGLADRVLIATTSEFGRRVAENSGGLDHGTASCCLLMGPVVAGVHGEQPSLRRLDRDGNLVATLGMERYYAMLATWLGVDPADVLRGAPRPVERLLLT